MNVLPEPFVELDGYSFYRLFAAQFIQGNVFILSQRANEAIGPLSEALRLDPVEPRAPYLNLLGIAFYATG